MPEIPELSSAKGRFVPAVGSPDTAAAPARAQNEIARGIMELGQPFEVIADRIVQTEDAREGSRLRNEQAEGFANLQLELANESDPSKHQPRVNEFLAQQRKNLDAAKFSDPERQRATMDFDRFSSGAKIQIAGDAARLSRERATLQTKNEVNRAKERGDRSGFETAIDRGVQGGLFLPEVKDGLMDEFDQQNTFRTIQREIREDPMEWEKKLDDPDILKAHPHLTLDAVDSLKREAGIEKNRFQAETWENVLNSALSGTTLSKAELEQMSQDGVISAQQRSAYLDRWHRPQDPQHDPAVYNELFAAVQQYDTSSDPTGGTIAELRGRIAVASLPDESISELQNRLKLRISPVKKVEHDLAAMFSKQSDERFEAGDFGKDWWAWQPSIDTKGQVIPNRWRKEIISREKWAAAQSARREFSAAFDGFLSNSDSTLNPVKAQEVYDALFEKMVLDREESRVGPAIPKAVDYIPDVEKRLGIPKETSANGAALPETATFGGQAIRPEGSFYTGARATVFGGKSDPADNGLSAFGGVTGAGGRQGVAIPQAILQATFPGKDKKWHAENVRVVVRTGDGRQAVFGLADYGTAEHVWQRDGKPVLDLTEGAARQLGGAIARDEKGNMKALQGLDGLSFAITTASGGIDEPLSSLSWEETQSRWWKQAKPTDPQQIANGLAALRDQWLEAQYADDGPAPRDTGASSALLPDKE
jgi:hypothetical protein